MFLPWAHVVLERGYWMSNQNVILIREGNMHLQIHKPNVVDEEIKVHHVGLPFSVVDEGPSERRERDDKQRHPLWKKKKF